MAVAVEVAVAVGIALRRHPIRLERAKEEAEEGRGTAALNPSSREDARVRVVAVVVVTPCASDTQITAAAAAAAATVGGWVVPAGGCLPWVVRRCTAAGVCGRQRREGGGRWCPGRAGALLVATCQQEDM